MDKPTFKRSCPDCGTTFTVDSTYLDEAYEAHARGDKNAVCSPCFNAFAGITIDDLIGTDYDFDKDREA